ncbi:protein SERAC1-like [Branchiostoma floridae x Branchiostoma japonicum]
MYSQRFSFLRELCSKSSGEDTRINTAWKITKIAAWTSLVVGGAFITSQVYSLRDAFRHRTNAVNNENRPSSYIYPPTSLPAQTQETQDSAKVEGGEFEPSAKVPSIPFPNLQVSNNIFTSWLPWVPSPLARPKMHQRPDDPWRFLKAAQSEHRATRLEGVEKLASIKHWSDSDYRAVAQALDNRTLIGLARSHDPDSRFFLPPPSPPKTGGLLEDELRSLLSSLPRDGIDKCTLHFTSKAMQHGRAAFAEDRGGLWCFGGNGLSFAQSLSNVPEEKVLSFCLQALVKHSKVPSHCSDIVRLGGLQLLQRAYRSSSHSAQKILRNIVRVIGNLAVHEQLHRQIIQAGWVTILSSLMKSDHISLVTHAARALANLDRDTCNPEKYQDGVYLFHPQDRSREAIRADIVFVHGLLGGAIKTWRQQDNTDDHPEMENHTHPEMENHTHPEEGEEYTECWPKSWLAKDCPNLRILSVEYDTHLSDWQPICPVEQEKRSLANRSREILEKLKAAGVGTRPIIWVTHSMGGLLVKKMLTDSLQDSSFGDLADNTKGILFYSTPHFGSSLAAYSTQVRYLLFPSVEVRELSHDNATLKKLHEDFTVFVDTKQVDILTLAETVPTNIAQGTTIKTLIVPLKSANPGFGEFHQVDVNHLNVCKPENKDSILYELTLQFIQRNVPKSTLAEKLERQMEEIMDNEYIWRHMQFLKSDR